MASCKALATRRAAPARLSALPSLTVLLGLVVAPVIVLDQATKYYIRTHLLLYHSVVIVPHWLDITFTMNPGAAFSLFVNAPPYFRSAFLFALSAIAIAVILVLLARHPTLNISSASLALILAGACGNLIDRVRFARVLDFVDVHYYSHHYPIFNVADSAISVGVVLIIATSLLGSSSKR